MEQAPCLELNSNTPSLRHRSIPFLRIIFEHLNQTKASWHLLQEQLFLNIFDYGQKTTSTNETNPYLHKTMYSFIDKTPDDYLNIQNRRKGDISQSCFIKHNRYISTSKATTLDNQFCAVTLKLEKASTGAHFPGHYSYTVTSWHIALSAGSISKKPVHEDYLGEPSPTQYATPTTTAITNPTNPTTF